MFPFDDVIMKRAKQYCSKPGATLLVLSGWHNAMSCLVLSRVAMSCMAQNKLLLYMLMTVSNTGCNWFAQSHRVCKVRNGYSYLLKKYDMWKTTETRRKQDEARPGPIFYLLSWSPSHLEFFLQVTWPFSIFTLSDLEAEIPSDFGCWLGDILGRLIVICISYLFKFIYVTLHGLYYLKYMHMYKCIQRSVHW